MKKKRLEVWTYKDFVEQVLKKNPPVFISTSRGNGEFEYEYVLDGKRKFALVLSREE